MRRQSYSPRHCNLRDFLSHRKPLCFVARVRFHLRQRSRSLSNFSKFFLFLLFLEWEITSLDRPSARSLFNGSVTPAALCHGPWLTTPEAWTGSAWVSEKLWREAIRRPSMLLTLRLDFILISYVLMLQMMKSVGSLASYWAIWLLFESLLVL